MVIIKNIEIRSTLRKDNYLELASNLSHVNINSGDYLIKVGVNKILATTKVIETLPILTAWCSKISGHARPTANR